MAKLIAGFGSSHSPMLAAQVEDWVDGAFVGRDRARQFVDLDGTPCRYDDLLATSLSDSARLRRRLAAQGRVILALDGLQPEVGHEVLWVIRDGLSGEVLLARRLLSGTARDLAPLRREVASAVGEAGPRFRQAQLGGMARRGVPVAGVLSDGQTSIRRAVEQALPGIPHQLCQCHFLREAALPIFEADRHAKKALKTQVRGVRPIERSAERAGDPPAAMVQGDCAAVRSAITEDGQAPLAASGWKLKERLEKVAASVERVAEKGGPRRSLRSCNS